MNISDADKQRIVALMSDAYWKRHIQPPRFSLHGQGPQVEDFDRMLEIAIAEIAKLGFDREVVETTGTVVPKEARNEDRVRPEAIQCWSDADD